MMRQNLSSAWLEPDLEAAAARLSGVVRRTPLQWHAQLSEQYRCQVYLKREDLQLVRSYKLRGAYNLMGTLEADTLAHGVVCASAGNHAQGFAWSCQRLGARGVVFMPVITPRQKVTQTRMFGGAQVEIRLAGDTFDDCAAAARAFAQQQQMTFVPPFDHPQIIAGQATVGLEICEDLPNPDLVFVPVGGGGLSAGVGCALRRYAPGTRLIGVEPEGAPSMTEALRYGAPVTLNSIDRFVDGAAVKRVGDLNFRICREVLHDMLCVPEGQVCSTILQLYNADAIVVEPAGALSIAALAQYADEIEGKTVVCVVSGSNNDIDRMPEIKERSLQFEGLKHYFLIRFAQRPGALREFVTHVLGPEDDITRFEYMQKTNKETGPALVGIELSHRRDYQRLLNNLKSHHIDFSEINKNDTLFSYLV
jgi:threonine dehydratase